MPTSRVAGSGGGCEAPAEASTPPTVWPCANSTPTTTATAATTTARIATGRALMLHRLTHLLDGALGSSDEWTMLTRAA